MLYICIYGFTSLVVGRPVMEEKTQNVPPKNEPPENVRGSINFVPSRPSSLAPWIFVLVQKDSNSKKESFC